MLYEELQRLSTAFPGKQVMVIGDIMLDEYIWGEVRRISPEAPVPVVEINHRTYVPGGAANTAMNIVSLSGEVLLGGVVGHDQQSERLRQELIQGSVNEEGLIVDRDRPTTTKTRVIAHTQQIVRLDSENRTSLPIHLEDKLAQWFEKRIDEADACALCDYDKGVLSPRLTERLIALARKAGKPVVVDPKGTNYIKYRGATVITPNVQEAEKASNCEIKEDTDLLCVGQELLRLLEGSAILITRGSRGMSLFLQGAQPIHIPAVARTVFDVTGAGDTVVGALTLALTAGASLEQATRLANRAAGIVVGKVGTATVTISELLQDLSHDRPV